MPSKKPGVLREMKVEITVAGVLVILLGVAVALYFYVDPGNREARVSRDSILRKGDIVK